MLFKVLTNALLKANYAPFFVQLYNVLITNELLEYWKMLLFLVFKQKYP